MGFGFTFFSKVETKAPEIMTTVKKTTATGSLIEKSTHYFEGSNKREWRIGGLPESPNSYYMPQNPYSPYPYPAQKKENSIIAFFRNLLSGKKGSGVPEHSPYHNTSQPYSPYPANPQGLYPGMPDYMTPEQALSYGNGGIRFQNGQPQPRTLTPAEYEQYHRFAYGETVQGSPEANLPTLVSQENTPTHVSNQQLQEHDSQQPVLTRLINDDTRHITREINNVHAATNMFTSPGGSTTSQQFNLPVNAGDHTTSQVVFRPEGTYSQFGS